jgi:hypothetical protein
MFIRAMKLFFCAQSGRFVAKFTLSTLKFNEKWGNSYASLRKGETLMKTKKFKCVSIVVVVLVLLVVVGTALGQEPDPSDPEGDPDGSTAIVPAEVPDATGEELGEQEEVGEEVDDGGIEEVVEEVVEEAEYILAQPPYTMNYQGYLTDGSGNPLNGTYNLVFRLYDAASEGNLEWGPETHNNVQVTNGIFQVVLGSSVTLYPNDFDEALYLGVWVNDTAVPPRQPLRAVPYAFGLVPGAEVQGAPEGTNYGLYVNNTATDSSNRGIYAQGNDIGVYAYGVTDYGLYASSMSGTYAIFSADVTYSSKGYAGPETYVWLPAMDAALKYLDLGQAHIEVETYGEVQIAADAAADVDVEIPIQIEVPYGRQYLLRSARVYYKVDSDCYIADGWILGRDFGSNASWAIGHNSTDGTSTSFTYYTINATDYYTVTATQAPTNLQIRLHMNNDSGDAWLYGVRLQLDSSY